MPNSDEDTYEHSDHDLNANQHGYIDRDPY
jgi:hypothetical protein